MLGLFPSEQLVQYSWRRAQFRVYLISLIFGALAGILILYPASEFVFRRVPAGIDRGHGLHSCTNAALFAG